MLLGSRRVLLGSCRMLLRSRCMLLRSRRAGRLRSLLLLRGRTAGRAASVAGDLPWLLLRSGPRSSRSLTFLGSRGGPGRGCLHGCFTIGCCRLLCLGRAASRRSLLRCRSGPALAVLSCGVFLMRFVY